ncbi:MAG: hydrogenase maturation protease [Pseudomonadota bacterium]
MTAPILIFGWGNPSRGDDALGPLLVERIDAMNLPGVECLTDFQLQVEHTLDLIHRQHVLFVDASLDAEPPFCQRRLFPARDATFTTHAMSPEAVMQTYIDLHNTPPPPCALLAIRGESFDLGAPLGPAASKHLEAALDWAIRWIEKIEEGTS